MRYREAVDRAQSEVIADVLSAGKQDMWLSAGRSLSGYGHKVPQPATTSDELTDLERVRRMTFPQTDGIKPWRL